MGKTLVLAEKPSAANDYAKALGCKEKKDGYIEGDNYIISWTFGHLFTLKEPGDYDEKYSEWKLEDLPIIPKKFGIKLVSGASKQFKIIKELVNRNDIDFVINGGDPGREGELIQRYVLMASGNKKPVKRLWVSTLTDSEIKKGFANLKESSKYDNLYYAAAARNEIDFLLGINYTRLYTLKKAGKGVMLSIGRCQTPMLNIIVERDIEIENFKSVPYYEVEAQFHDYVGKYINEENTRIDSIEESEKIKKYIEGKLGIIAKIDTEQKSTPPPQLYNLTNLQKVMNRKYGFSAKKTLDLAQKLYEHHKILSYPRTSSRYLSESLVPEFPKRLEILKFGNFESAIKKLDTSNLKVTKRFVDDSKLSDHHSIIPTDNENIKAIYEELTKDEKNLFDEVVLTFIACFYEDYKYESIIVITDIEGYKFKTTGKTELKKGWKEIYKETLEKKEEQKINSVKEGQKENVIRVEVKNKKTEPPKKFTEDSLLTQLEKYGIGTEATRANLIETLLKREFIKRKVEKKKEHLISTQLGRELIKAIETDELKSVELTSILENKLELIASGKMKKSEIMEETINHLKENTKTLMENENCELIERHREGLGKCPFCHEGDITEYKTGYGCNKYNENNCNFFVKKEVQGKKIGIDQIKKLLEYGKTDVIQGFKAKKEGKTFDAALMINKNKIVFKFLTDEDLYLCPVCKKGHIKSGKRGFYCSDYKKCKFFISYEIAGIKISTSQIKKLIEKGKTNIIKGFTSNKGKSFDATLIIKDGQVKFQS